VRYEIPAELVRDKRKATVRFESVTNEAGPVFGVRLVR